MKKKSLVPVDDRAHRELVEAVTNVAIYRLDPAGHVESWNPGARRFKGYAPEEIIGRHFSCLYTEEDRKDGLPERALDEAARKGTFEAEGWRVRKDGSRFWAQVVIDPIRDESGLVTGFAKVTHDVTHSHVREAEVAKINASLEQQVLARTALLRNLTVLQRAILADAAMGIIATDVNGTITLFNPAAQRMLGYREAELVGKKTPSIFHDDAEMAGHANAMSAEQGMPIEASFQAAAAKARTGVPDTREWSFIRKDGSRQPLLLSVTALRDDDGDIFGYLGIAVDLTERRERENLLLARTREAEAAVIAKSRFLANMSHEIRSPMNAILGMLQILLRTDLSASQADYAAKAYSATELLLHLLNDILDFSKIEADKLVLESAPFSLDTLMCDLQTLTAAMLGDKPLALDVSIEPGLGAPVMGDAFRLRQVLLNLIGNAVKFTARGKIKVTLRRPPGERRRSIVQFAVEDTGIGIAAEQLTTIFDDFQQGDSSTTRPYGGAGLGLSISRKLISLMGGRLNVESTPGVGSRFSFTLALPLDERAAPSRQPPAASKSAKPLAGLALLVVEDTPLNQEVARHLLTGAGAEVTVAASGPLGLELAQTAEPPFDIILMDLQMPGMDGLEATRRLRDSTKTASTPIIAMTANVMASDREACLAGGMNDYVVKPFNIADLVCVILSHRPTPRQAGLFVDGGLALHRLAGDEALFVRISRQFVRDSAPLLDELADALRREAPAEGAALLHKLKSLAGVVGADHLASRAARLEAEL
jgi:PAS domain S-box-containing protein